MSENNLTETRPLTEIWKSLSVNEQEDLRYALLMSKVAKTRQAIFYWVTGQRVPSNDVIKERIAQVVSKKIGKKATSHTLFPR